jgi:hypothetical protein
MSTIAEALMVISAWCGMSTYSRANAEQVNACRAQMISCVEKQLGRLAQDSTLWTCAKQQKLVD